MPSYDWSEERVGQLRELCEAGLSSTQIAAELGGITRNAVIGKLARLGVKLKGAPPAHRTNRQTIKLRQPKRQQVGGLTLRKFGSPTKPSGEEATDLPADFSLNPISLMESKEHHCRWPVSADGEPFMCCGDEKMRHSSYCARHHRIACPPRFLRNMSEQEYDKRRAGGRRAHSPVTKVLAFEQSSSLIAAE